MSSISKMKQSRGKWKQKAVKRGEDIRYYKKENRRLKQERTRYKNEVSAAKHKLMNFERGEKSLCIVNKSDLIHISLQLFIVARIGFRAVSRVLDLLSSYLGIKKAPCCQTIINWVNRLSIVRMQQGQKLMAANLEADNNTHNGFIWMVDISIGLGAGKILTVLAVTIKHHHNNPKAAPTLQDCHSVAVSVEKTWTGESIAAFLKKVIATLGKPAGLLKDGGTDLAKSARLLAEQEIVCPCIDDVSHKIANLLKHEYSNNPLFDTFISACGKISKNFKQTALACLAPPKVSHKSRFMNLHKLVLWASKLLKHAQDGKATKGSMLLKLRQNMSKLEECKEFIEQLTRDITPLLSCQKILKTQGLNNTTYDECQKILMQTIPTSSNVRIGFEQWLTQNYAIAKKLGVEESGLLASTDLLESLFGVGKQHGTGQVKDANRIAMRQPALCGKVTKEDAQSVLAVTVKQENDIFGNISSLVKQRRAVLPNPENLETLSDSCQKNTTIELIPVLKTGSKNIEKPYHTSLIKKINDPPNPDYKIECMAA